MSYANNKTPMVTSSISIPVSSVSRMVSMDYVYVNIYTFVMFKINSNLARSCIYTWNRI
jgi:hypothetical protein